MEVLGRGRFAIVKKVNNLAVKTIYTDDQVLPHNWRAEVAALDNVRSPNVITAENVLEKLEIMEPYVAISMQLLSYTLEAVIYQNAKANFPANTGFRNAMPLDRATQIIKGIANGLTAINAQGIIHRDLKPENIMFLKSSDVSASYNPIIIDFGIAYVPGVSKEEFNEKITQISTNEYKSPEALYGVKNYTEKVDIWALGCLLARLLNPDCTPLFTPYTSEIGLVLAQKSELGPPDLNNCPSLSGCLSPCWEGTKEPGVLDAITAKFENEPNAKTLVSLMFKMLDFEWTNRPSAEEIVNTLN